MVRFLAYGGLRYGECVALRVGSVDTDNRRVMVVKSITQVRGQGPVEGETKTHQRRSAPILTTALAEELKQVVQDRDPSEFLFPGPDGGAMTIGWFRARFDKAVAKLGVAGVTPHTLRALCRIAGTPIRGLGCHGAKAAGTSERRDDDERLLAHAAR
jgi:integrase